MDTKSKKFSGPLWVKVAASLLIVVCIGGISLQTFDMAYRSWMEDFSPTLAKSYENDGSIAWRTSADMLTALRAGFLLKSEEHIKQGDSLDQERLRDRWKGFFQEYFREFVEWQTERYLYSQEDDVPREVQEGLVPRDDLFAEYQNEFIDQSGNKRRQGYDKDNGASHSGRCLSFLRNAQERTNSQKLA